MRFYMVVGKWTPNNALSGDIGWKPPLVSNGSIFLDIGQDWPRWILVELILKFLNGL